MKMATAKWYVTLISGFLLLSCPFEFPHHADAQEADPDTIELERISMGDPFVLRHDGTWYLTGTTMSSRGFELWSSQDLKQWVPHGTILSRDAGFGKTNFWAPELFVNGTVSVGEMFSEPGAMP